MRTEVKGDAFTAPDVQSLLCSLSRRKLARLHLLLVSSVGTRVRTAPEPPAERTHGHAHAQEPWEMPWHLISRAHTDPFKEVDFSLVSGHLSPCSLNAAKNYFHKAYPGGRRLRTAVSRSSPSFPVKSSLAPLGENGAGPGPVCRGTAGPGTAQTSRFDLATPQRGPFLRQGHF